MPSKSRKENRNSRRDRELLISGPIWVFRSPSGFWQIRPGLDFSIRVFRDSSGFLSFRPGFGPNLIPSRPNDPVVFWDFLSGERDYLYSGDGKTSAPTTSTQTRPPLRRLRPPASSGNVYLSLLSSSFLWSRNLCFFIATLQARLPPTSLRHPLLLRDAASSPQATDFSSVVLFPCLHDVAVSLSQSRRFTQVFQVCWICDYFPYLQHAMLTPEEVFSGKGDIKEEAELTQADRKRRRATKLEEN
ncbi:hypothetical protein LXL04_013453 [Taraxacum kok-saghyz]